MAQVQPDASWSTPWASASSALVQIKAGNWDAAASALMAQPGRPRRPWLRPPASAR